MLLNPNKVTAAVHFDVPTPQAVGFTLQTNSTPKFFKGKYQDSLNLFNLPLQVATEREIARRQYSLAGQALSDWTVRLKAFPHPSLSTSNIVGQVIGPFLFAASMFSFVPVISGVVGEQELGLRQMLRTMGMLDSSYWLSWMVFEMVMGMLMSLLIIAFGAIFQLSLFLHNSFGILFFLFFLFQLAMASFAFLCSVPVRKATTAVNLGFLVFIAGWIMQVVIIFGYPYSPDYYRDVVPGTVIFTLLPWSVFVKALQDLGDAVTGQQPGIEWHNRFRPWFFLQPGYWRPKRSTAPNVRQHTSQRRHPSSATSAEAGLVNADAGETLDPDVAAEAARVWDNNQNPF
ncbi:hypothetical protein ABBQ38_001737 [Trebouxia sp. C0009 RCD-2024]